MGGGKSSKDTLANAQKENGRTLLCFCKSLSLFKNKTNKNPVDPYWIDLHAAVHSIEWPLTRSTYHLDKEFHSDPGRDQSALPMYSWPSSHFMEVLKCTLNITFPSRDGNPKSGNRTNASMLIKYFNIRTFQRVKNQFDRWTSQRRSVDSKHSDKQNIFYGVVTPFSLH